jgi:site-specific DNA-methyltransferase (adenine-specific)
MRFPDRLKSKGKQMKLEVLKISSLKLDPKNARSHDQGNLDAIAGSLTQFGQRKPIVISQDNTVVAGNGTLTAAMSLGWTDIEVVRVPTDWDDARIKAFALADNRTAELATWNQEIMASQLLELQEAGFDIEEFGFELHEPPVDLEAIKEDEVPEVAISRAALGDIWQLGKHRLMCGDSFSSASIDALLDGHKVDLVFTDPPYGMSLDTDYSKMGASKTKYKKIENDDQLFDASRIMKLVDAPIWYLWGADYYPSTIPNWDQGSIIVWAKAHSEAENSVFGSAFELCWRYPKTKKEVWFVRRIQMTNELLTAHPTQKPLALPLRAIEKDTDKGDIVFDFFLGSGTTLIACEQLERVCLGLELDPQYCDVIIQRWENLTGLKAELLNASR